MGPSCVSDEGEGPGERDGGSGGLSARARDCCCPSGDSCSIPLHPLGDGRVFRKETPRHQRIRVLLLFQPTPRLIQSDFQGPSKLLPISAIPLPPPPPPSPFV